MTAPASLERPDADLDAFLVGHRRNPRDRSMCECGSTYDRCEVGALVVLAYSARESAHAEHARAEALASKHEEWDSMHQACIGLREVVDAEHARAEALAAEVRETSESLGGMVEWLAEVVVDLREALRVGGCNLHVLTAEQWGALNAATQILARERNANPSRYDLMRTERDAARASLAALDAELRAWAEDEHFGDCALYRPYRTVDGPPPCNCHMAAFRAVLDRHAPDAATTTTAGTGAPVGAGNDADHSSRVSTRPGPTPEES